MRQDKDRSAKWTLTHHGDAILKLAGLTNFTAWKALQAETVAPRRLPDGLLEVRFADQEKPPVGCWWRSRPTRTQTRISRCGKT